jgi:hypothetical protein
LTESESGDLIDIFTDPCPCRNSTCKLSATSDRHGTPNGYGNNKCRCDACTTAWAEYSITRRHARRERGLDPGDERHGTDNGYTNYACRSTTCAQDGAYGCVQARADARKTVVA